ncbi:MAG: HAMP domain-containing sensor histidine kinase [Bacilli bacterium]|nr:HAMP domain-containing sensor histidine kinase [Bacilli bacterium]
MKLKKNSIRAQILIYLVVFSLAILAFLWFFQVIFINTYYEWVKTKEIETIANQVTNIYDDDNKLDLLSYDSGVCIQVIRSNNIIYDSKNFNRGCNVEINYSEEINTFKKNFMNGSSSNHSLITVNTRLNNKTIFYGVEIENNIYAFINTSLEPIDSTITILKNQLIIVTVIVIALSSVIAYFISQKLSKPIVKINKIAKKMADGDHDTSFDESDGADEIRQLATTLNYANKELARTDELRRDLMANVSHDLKTPLTMIKAYAEMIRDLTYKNKEKRNDNLNVIINETDRLNLLVNDILDLSSMQSGTYVLQYERFDLTGVIKNIIKQFKILTETEDYQFIFEYKNHAMVYADKKRIEQVIYNLVNNAINYTGKDKIIEIVISSNDIYYKVEIKDTGKGISDEKVKLIWDKYYKVDKNYHRKSKGTGLGLSIVKNILTAHSLEYGVHSVINKGTVFYFNIKKSDE